MGIDQLGDRMKNLEKRESSKRFMPLLPICIRLDGRSFSKFTKKLERPYDVRLSAAMQETTRLLAKETNAVIGYTQSDEISLILYSSTYNSQIYFDGKIQKIVSCLASLCSVIFYQQIMVEFYPFYKELFGNKIPSFDCRAWQVPNLMEAVNTIVWREIDCTKNSVSMATRKYYSAKEMHGKGRADQMDMLMDKGVNWNNYPTFFKRGSYFQRKTFYQEYSTKELALLPKNHNAHTCPTFERSGYFKIDLPPITKIENKIDVIINGLEPQMKETN